LQRPFTRGSGTVENSQLSSCLKDDEVLVQLPYSKAVYCVWSTFREEL